MKNIFNKVPFWVLIPLSVAILSCIFINIWNRISPKFLKFYDTAKVVHDTVYANKTDTNKGKYFLISYYAMNGEYGKYSYGNVTMSCTGCDNIPNDSCLKNYVYNSIKCDAPWTKNRIGIMGITPLTEYDFNHFYDGDKNSEKFNPCK